MNLAPALNVTAVRTRKGAAATITVTVALPDGTTVTRTLAGARAERAEAVWVGNPDLILEMGCLADPAAAQRKADGLRKSRRLWDFDGTRYVQVTVAFPAGWALVEDAAE